MGRAMKNKKNKKDFSKFIVVLVIIMNIVFTKDVLDAFRETGNEPTTLITCFFGFTTGELWMLASIKKKKVTNTNSNLESGEN